MLASAPTSQISGAMKESRAVSISLENEPRQMIVETEIKEDLDSPTPEIEKLEQWNKTKVDVYRYLAALYSFIIMGMNDAAYGVRPQRHIANN
jgi:CO dehydrogenase/acetyl-CoA synthase alpha subunit